jgi:hypothetical protein
LKPTQWTGDVACLGRHYSIHVLDGYPSGFLWVLTVAVILEVVDKGRLNFLPFGRERRMDIAIAQPLADVPALKLFAIASILGQGMIHSPAISMKG